MPTIANRLRRLRPDSQPPWTGRPSRWSRSAPTSSTTRCRRTSSRLVLGPAPQVQLRAGGPRASTTLADAEAAALARDLRARRPRGRPAHPRARLRLGLAHAVDGASAIPAAASPRSPTRIRSASTSRPRRARRGLANVRVITARHERVRRRRALRPHRLGRDVRAHAQLARAVRARARWLRPGGRFFMHVFCHRATPYAFEDRDAGDWMSRHFFSGGMMPSDDLALRFQDDLRCVEPLALGRHALRAHGQRLAREHRRAARRRCWPMLDATYGAAEARAVVQRWRVFFMACAELFGYRGGQEWWVSHYLFERPRPAERPPAMPLSVIVAERRACSRSAGSRACSAPRTACRGSAWSRAAAIVAVAPVARGAPARGASCARRCGAAIGAVFETRCWCRRAGCAFAAARCWHGIAPLWMVALWALFATTLNVSLRWLRARPVIAARARRGRRPARVLGRRAPGRAQLADAGAALVAIAVGWAVLTPLLLRRGAALRRVRARMTASRHAGLAALPALLALARRSRGRSRPPRRNVGSSTSSGRCCSCSPRCRLTLPGALRRPRGALVLALVAAWALRLAGYLAWRNWDAPEDRRYQAIRARNEPGFAWKSLYLVFGLQAVLAWIVSAPLRRGHRQRRAARTSLDCARRRASWRSASPSRRSADCAARALQGRSGQQRPRAGPRPVALHAPPELLRRVLRLVGLLPDRAGGRRLVDGVLAAADVGAAAARSRASRCSRATSASAGRPIATTSRAPTRSSPARARAPR